MTATRNNDTYNVYMFQMTISVAHELGHFLTGFLSGTGRPVTPDEVGVPGAAGEAGYFWESLALGGIVDFFADQSDPNNVEQPGVPYIFDDAQDDARGRKVSMTWINDFVSGRRGKIPRIRRRRYANFDLSLLIYAMVCLLIVVQASIHPFSHAARAPLPPVRIFVALPERCPGFAIKNSGALRGRIVLVAQSPGERLHPPHREIVPRGRARSLDITTDASVLISGCVLSFGLLGYHYADMGMGDQFAQVLVFSGRNTWSQMSLQYHWFPLSL